MLVLLYVRKTAGGSCTVATIARNQCLVYPLLAIGLIAVFRLLYNTGHAKDAEKVAFHAKCI